MTRLAEVERKHCRSLIGRRESSLPAHRLQIAKCKIWITIWKMAASSSSSTDILCCPWVSLLNRTEAFNVTYTKLRSVAMILLSSRWWRLSLLHHLVDQPQSSQLHINTAVNLHNLHSLSCKSSLAWEHRCGRLSLHLQLWWRKQKKRGGGSPATPDCW